VWEEKRNAYRILVEKYIRKNTTQKTQDNINMDHKEIGLEGMGWINLAQDTCKWWAVL
jgi:hypothetical protein